jgi:hypothetical protein
MHLSFLIVNKVDESKAKISLLCTIKTMTNRVAELENVQITTIEINLSSLEIHTSYK